MSNTYSVNPSFIVPTGIDKGNSNATAPTIETGCVYSANFVWDSNTSTWVQMTANSGGGGNPAAGVTGSVVPSDASYTGFNSGGNLVGVSTSNPLPTSITGTVPVSIATMPSTPVTGVFWQATQPVSGTISTTPPTNATTNVTQFGNNNIVTGVGIGGLGIPRVTVSSDSFPSTQAVTQSGSWSSGRTWSLNNSSDSVNAVQSGVWNVGSITTLPSIPSGSSTIGSVKLIDSAGANLGAIKASNTPVSSSDTSLSVGLSPNSPLPAGSNALGSVSVTGVTSVSGTVSANTVINNVVSTLNSTTAILGANATFTGTYELVQNYTTIDVLVYSDQASATNSLFIDFSSDGVNLDASDAYSIPAANGIGINNEPHGKYFRIRYVNGPIAQSVFRLQTILDIGTPTQHKVMIGDVLSPYGVAILTKGAITGKTTGGGGGYVDVKVNPSGALAVDGSGVTQPVSGTITGNQGSANSVANAWPLKITDGTNTSAVKAASISASSTDPALVVAISPNNTVATTQSGSWTNTVTQATPSNLQATVTPISITKGTQGATGFTVQELKDAGRNVTNYFMAAQVISTATEALQSLTGYKGGVAVTATTTPAVVTTGKTYRINNIVITYVAIATAGAIQVNLRANLSGVVAIGSPLVNSWLIGAPSATAGVLNQVSIDFPDGLEFAAGTGIGLTVLGVGATGTAAITGYAKISLAGYEY